MASTVLKYCLVVIVSGSIAIVAFYGMGLGNVCTLKQIDIKGDLNKYDQTKDPELCSQINDKISQFDTKCNGDIETLDCG